MIPKTLIAPIDYEAFYASEENDDTQRFKALSAMLYRLNSVGWLSNGVLSVHIFDWDWRSESNRFNHRHVPMMFFTSDIFDWYRDYGAFLQLDPQRGQQFSFARFFLELAPRRDIIDVRFDLNDDNLFSIERENRPKTNGETEADASRVFVPEKVKMRLNLSLARRLCDPMAEFLNAFRRECPPSEKPGTHKIISLADAIGDLKEPVSRLTNISDLSRTSVKAYIALPDQPLTQMGVGKDLILHGPKPLECELPKEDMERDLRFLLANLAVHAFVLPESLWDSAFALVPGIARVSDGSPMASGGFLLHYNTPKPAVDLEDWLFLATTWAREKATFDLVEKNRRQQLARYVHQVSNKFDTLISRVAVLNPVDEARDVAYEMDNLKTSMEGVIETVRGEAKDPNHTPAWPGKVLPDILKGALSNLAGNKSLLIKLFIEKVTYDYALGFIHEKVFWYDFPEAFRSKKMAFSRQAVEYVLTELIKNGLGYTPWEEASEERVEVSFGLDQQGLYVEVTNPVADDMLSKLEKISNSLRRKSDLNVVAGLGIKAVTDFCTNEGLPWPAMSVDRDGLKVVMKCYLARFWEVHLVNKRKITHP